MPSFFPLCKEAEISESGSSFAKVLRSYQTGGITYSDFLGHVNRYLAAGEAPAELLEVLRRRQLIEPLPDFAHDAVAHLLNEPGSASTPETAAPTESAPEPEVIPTPTAQPGPEPATPSLARPPEHATTIAIPRAGTNVSDYPSPLRAIPTPHPAAPLRMVAAPEQDKTVVIPRAGTNVSDYAMRPRATPSLKPVPPQHAPPERTVVIPRDGVITDEYELPPPENSDAALPDHDASNAQPAAVGRQSGKMRAVWLSTALGAALIAAVIGWVYSRPSMKTHPTAAATAVVHSAVPALPPTVAAAAPGTTIQDCATCPRMMVLPPGRFKQGSAYDDLEASPAEKPQHIVLIRHPLAMATTELSVANFQEFVAATGHELQGCEIYDGQWRHDAAAGWQAPGFAQSPEHPVTCVSWTDAVAYADWLSAKTGHHYRLPSASEWEYAARSGTDAPLPWSAGQQAACEHANVADKGALRQYPKWNVFACTDGYVNTAPTGSFKANPFGISDMLGNVFEWTEDCWHDDYAKAPIDGSARMDGDCNEHELRGGSWFSSPAFVRYGYRNHFATAYRSSSIGLRLVREMTP